MNRYKLMRYQHGGSRSQAQVAEATGLNLKTLQKLEQGLTDVPSSETANKLADLYGLSVAQVLGVEERAA